MSERIAIQRQLFKKSYVDFFQAFWGVLEPSTQLSLNWHLGLIAAKLQYAGLKVANRQPREKHLMVNVSPGSGKSRLGTELFVPWLLCNNPGLKILVASYSTASATKFAISIRRVMSSQLYKTLFPECALENDNTAASRMYTKAGGLIEICSPGSATTAKRGDVLILDDIISAGMGSSQVENQNVIEWYENSLASRLNNLSESLMIVNTQRLSSLDICAYLLEKMGSEFETIVLPIRPSDQMSPSLEQIRLEYPEAYLEGTLDSQRFPLIEVDKLEANTTPDTFESQYQQQPGDLSDSVFKREWVDVISEAEGLPLGAGRTRSMVIDSAGSDKASSDQTCVGIFFSSNGVLYLQASYFVNYSYGKLKSFIIDLIIRNSFGVKNAILVENAGPTGGALLADIVTAGYNAIALSHEGKSKADRMRDPRVLLPVMAKRFKIIQHINAKKMLAQFCGPIRQRLEDGRDVCVYGIRELMQSGMGNGRYNMSIVGGTEGTVQIKTDGNKQYNNRYLNLASGDKFLN
jgi:hypothetical protein